MSHKITIFHPCDSCGKIMILLPCQSRRRFCDNHCYGNWKRGRGRTPINERFWTKVDTSGECWVWIGKRNTNGYGVIGVSRTPEGAKTKLAHRISWELHFGAIPSDLAICHRCDNRLCIRPDHLFLGTKSENTLDMVGKDRHAKGERSGNARVTEKQVIDIRNRYTDGGITQAALAREYNISQAAVGRVVTRKTWRHVE